ncbi:MAG: sigma-54 dependent transcriptional regulator [Planctomycetota bacterium]
MRIERVLIVDDEALNRDSLRAILEDLGCEVESADGGRAAIEALASVDVDLVITDLKMGEVSGMDVLAAARERVPAVPVVLVTAYGTIESAVQAMRLGAEDYLLKPFSIEQIELLLEKLSERRQLVLENAYLREMVQSAAVAADIVGESRTLREQVALARRVAQTKATVLILGESGTGKELFARLIHRECDRSERPFVRVNCAALSSSLLESELFGHEKGAFTGALHKREGRFELADRGTLLLDEIGELPLELQPKLLRVLEQQEFERVGGTRTLQVDVRLIASTNRDLLEEVEAGRFREDLYYRLNVYPITLPPLRERRDDIEILARHFLARYRRELGGGLEDISPDAIELLQNFNWPGNVRELDNLIQRVSIRVPGPLLTANDLREDLPKKQGVQKGTEHFVGQRMAQIEKEVILKTLERTGQNKAEAARILGVTARTLRNKLKVYQDA